MLYRPVPLNLMQVFDFIFWLATQWFICDDYASQGKYLPVAIFIN